METPRKMEFKKGTGKGLERNRKGVPEPGKRTQSVGTFRETPKRDRDGETEQISSGILGETADEDKKPPRLIGEESKRRRNRP